MAWTNERIGLLKKLWDDGLSASQIAGVMGDVTRNAVIGKVRRLGLSSREKSSISAKSRRGRPSSQLKAMLKPKEDLVQVPASTPGLVAVRVPIGSYATILTLTNRTCKWPIGDPSTDDFHFCGGQSDAGAPYCAHHCKLAYQPVAVRYRQDKRTVAGVA